MGASLLAVAKSIYYDSSVDLKPCSCNLPIIKLYILEYILGLHSSFRLR